MAKWRTQKRWFKGSNVGGDGMLPTHGCWPVIRVDVPHPYSPVGGGKAKTSASTNGFADFTRKSWRSCYQIVILSMKYKARSLTETLGMGKSLKREENDWKNHDKQWVTHFLQKHEHTFLGSAGPWRQVSRSLWRHSAASLWDFSLATQGESEWLGSPWTRIFPGDVNTSV